MNDDFNLGETIGKLTVAVQNQSTQIERQSKQIESLTTAVDDLKTYRTRQTAALQTFALFLGISGGAIGGKLAHWFGWFNDNKP